MRVSERLGQVDMPALLAVLPTDDREAASLISHGHLDAAQRQLLVVLWWD
ncbi:hypothetical protein [Streptomyces milbemycinicus]